MSETNIVILSDRSLFIEGVTNRLQQYLHQVTLKIIDPRQPDVMAQIIASQPSVVLLDGTDAKSAEFCSLSKLMTSLPVLKIIHLNLQQKNIQVITSEQHPAAEVRDLVGVIEQAIPDRVKNLETN